MNAFIKNSRLLLPILFVIGLLQLSPIQAQNLSGRYEIINTYGGPNHSWYGASLSWDGTVSHPMASVEFDDYVAWEFQAVPGKANTYLIVNTYGGPAHEWYGASLSWDGTNSHPMASVEFNDRVEWRLDPVSGKPNTYMIVNTYGGSGHEWYGASLSWDGTSSHPMASVEFNDRVEWLLRPAADEAPPSPTIAKQPDGAGWATNYVAGNLFDNSIYFQQVGPSNWELSGIAFSLPGASSSVSRNWVELQRDQWSVYLGIGNERVQLDLHRKEIIFPNMRFPITEFSEAQNGYMVSMVVHADGAGNRIGEFTQTGENSWQEISDEGNIYDFRETHRDQWSVYLFDESRDVYLQLDLHRKKVGYKVGAAGDHRDLYSIIDTYGINSPARQGIISFPGTRQSMTMTGFKHSVEAGGFVLVETNELEAGECALIYPKASAEDGNVSAEFGLLSCAVQLGDDVKLEMVAIYGGCEAHADIRQGGSGGQCEVGLLKEDLYLDMGNGSEAHFNIQGPSAQACGSSSTRMICGGASASLASTSFQVTDDEGNGMGFTLDVGVGAGLDAGYEDGVVSATLDLKFIIGGSITISADVSDIDFSNPVSATMGLAETAFKIRNGTVGAVTGYVKQGLNDVLGEDVAVVPNTIIWLFAEAPWELGEWFFGLF